MLAADGQLAGTPSVMFDAVALVLSTAGAQALFDEAAAIDFVRDAFGHLKAIALDEGGQALFDKAGCAADAGVVEASTRPRSLPPARRANGIVKGRSEPSPSDAWRNHVLSRTFSASSRSRRVCAARVLMDRSSSQVSSRSSSVGRGIACSSRSRRLVCICARIASNNNSPSLGFGRLFIAVPLCAFGMTRLPLSLRARVPSARYRTQLRFALVRTEYRAADQRARAACAVSPPRLFLRPASLSSRCGSPRARPDRPERRTRRAHAHVLRDASRARPLALDAGPGDPC